MSMYPREPRRRRRAPDGTGPRPGLPPGLPKLTVVRREEPRRWLPGHGPQHVAGVDHECACAVIGCRARVRFTRPAFDCVVHEGDPPAGDPQGGWWRPETDADYRRSATTIRHTTATTAHERTFTYPELCAGHAARWLDALHREGD